MRFFVAYLAFFDATGTTPHIIETFIVFFGYITKLNLVSKLKPVSKLNLVSKLEPDTKLNPVSKSQLYTKLEPVCPHGCAQPPL